MRLEKAVNIEDLHKMAKRHLPRAVFDYVEGGCEDEIGIAHNENAFANYRLIPRYLVDVRERSFQTTLFGKTYSLPFGIAPTGSVGLCRRGVECMQAAEAAAANVPFILSGVSNSSIEETFKHASQHMWYQLYASRELKESEDIIRRAKDVGVETLVITVDTPSRSRRERNIRNGFSLPRKLGLATKLEAATHPAWLLEYFRCGGEPYFETWRPYVKAGASAYEVSTHVSQNMLPPQSWDEIHKLRQQWPGNFVIKGIMSPDDALKAIEIGTDGIVISNHGGRQLDRAPASIEMLPLIKAAVGDRLTLMLDSGVRRGSDIVIALCLGAQYVFTGRATLYGGIAGGRPGVKKAIDILRQEIDAVMGQIGAPSVEALGPQFIQLPAAGR